MASVDKAIKVSDSPERKPLANMTEASQNSIAQSNMRDHGYAAFLDEKRVGIPPMMFDSYNQIFYNLWLRKSDEEKQVYVDKAVAAKGEEACKVAIPKTLKRSFDEVDGDETAKDTSKPADDDDEDEIDSDEEFEDMYIDKSCSEVRTLIKRYMAATGCTQKKFQDDANIGVRSFTTFMRATGPMGGSGTDCYHHAWLFFKKRETKGLPAVPKKEPAAKKAKTGDDKKKEAEKKKKEEEKYDVSDIVLEGEEQDKVPVFDTCDDVRKKIRAHSKHAGYTGAAFCRTMSTMFKAEPTKVNASSLATFLAKKGPTEGAGSNVYYAAYCFFEKLRIKQGKEKTEKRTIMEEKWKREKGVPRVNHNGFLMMADEVAVEDEYGRVEFMKKSQNRRPRAW